MNVMNVRKLVDDVQLQQQQQKQQQQQQNPFRKSSQANIVPFKNYSLKELLGEVDDDEPVAVERASAHERKAVPNKTKLDFSNFRDAVDGVRSKYGKGLMFDSRTSHLTPHTSHLTPHTSHLTPHTFRFSCC